MRRSASCTPDPHAGHRSDTILILHIPSNGGRAVLISLPRDSYVKIPGYGQNKINAAYSFGGPKLLAKTVQNNTGLRIEHYIGNRFRRPGERRQRGRRRPHVPADPDP